MFAEQLARPCGPRRELARAGPQPPLAVTLGRVTSLSLRLRGDLTSRGSASPNPDSAPTDDVTLGRPGAVHGAAEETRRGGATAVRLETRSAVERVRLRRGLGLPRLKKSPPTREKFCAISV